MGIFFNADEILEIAEQIERNGVGFYSRSAEIVTKPDAHQLFLDLAKMEKQHEQIFADMRKTLSEQEQAKTIFDPDDEAVLYLQAFADGHVFDINNNPADCLTGEETATDIIQMAIGMEKDSIVLYLGMKDVVPGNLGKSKIDDVIKEEMSHIIQLSNKLASLQQ